MSLGQDLDFRLRILLTVAKAGSITGAAQILGFSQPAVTRHIRLLEQRLGVRLLRRHGRGVALTPLGEHLRREVEDPFARIDNAIEKMADPEGEPVRHLQLATVHTVNLYLTGPLLADLRRQHKRLGIKVYCRSSEEVVHLVERGQCDVGLVYETKVNSDLLEHHFLHTEEFVLFHHPEMDLPRNSHGDVVLNRNVPLAVPPSSFAIRHALERMLGDEMNGVFEVETVDLMLQVTHSRGAACLLPNNIPHSMIESSGLARSRVSGHQLSRRVVAVFLRRRRGDPLIEAVIAALPKLAPGEGES